MANYANISSCIRTHFDTQWTALGNGIPHYFAGQAVDLDQLANRTWVRMSVNFGESQQVAMGGGLTGKRVRTAGIAAVQIFKPAEEGQGELFRLADSIASIWQVSTIESIVYRATSVQTIQMDGPWVMLPVFTPFQADEYVT